MKGTRLHVWALIGYWHAVGDAQRVAIDYGIPIEDVEAALAYYHEHENAIDMRLEANAVPLGWDDER